MHTPSQSVTNIPVETYGVVEPEKIERTPARPLGPLSDYVALRLPTNISKVRKGEIQLADIAVEVEALLSTTMSAENVSEADLPLSLYDVTIATTALRILSKELECEIDTPNLAALQQSLSEKRGVIPHLSYEGLIFANPIDTDPRNFLEGDLGRQELVFYKLHQLIEEEFRKALPIASSALQTRKDMELVIVDENLLGGLQAIKDCLENVTEYMRKFQRVVSKEAFSQARPFWGEAGDYQGPSGKFSASYFVMDSLLSGNDSDMRAFLQSKMNELSHYPNTTLEKDHFTGQQDMQESFSLTQEHPDLATLSQNSNNKRIKTLSAEVLRIAEMNRNVHIGLAKAFLPKEYKGNESGTGEKNTSMKDYLNRPRNAYSNLRSKNNDA